MKSGAILITDYEPDVLSDAPHIQKMITQDPRLLDLLDIAKNVADSDATILIQGESGTGKELLACYIHRLSRRKGPYIAVNCAALPESLSESELFGHEKGAFTGAIKRKYGKFELANDGTIVLDEISELSLKLQAKLLRVLQEKMIDRVGGEKPIPIEYRLIAISNLDLKMAVQEEIFREDLYYRINVIPMTIPPLRERIKDIHLLVHHFLEKYCTLYKKKMKTISSQAMSLLLKIEWRGNVRELENTIERMVLLSKTEIVLPDHLFIENLTEPKTNIVNIRSGFTLKEMEKELISQTLKELNNNRTRAAERLGISIRTLRNKLKEYKEKNMECKKVFIS